ncbi:MAG TPA: coenzyme F420-0:L-glutamate ligase [Patescibacteria group bacterium]|nr:coenzyme F420-0:L-glutamate ligase [Patescibacteria group bacterium]
MRVTAYKTDKITAGCCSLIEVLDEFLPALTERSVVVISSKVAGLCENRVVPIGAIDKDELIKQEADYFLPRTLSRYNVSFTITHSMLVPTAGIDESNANGNYVLWPKDPQETTNEARRYLCKKFKLRDVGVIMTDNCIRPLRWGVTGIAIAASGFEAVEDGIGKPDLFGRPLQFTKTSIQDGLAAAACLVMGEADRQTPLAVVEDVPFVVFTGRDPSPEELAGQIIEPEDDMYAPMLTSVEWLTGEGGGL